MEVMKALEVIRNIDFGDIRFSNSNQLIEAIEAKETLVELAEKQVPKSMYYEADGYADGKLVYDMAYCPRCNHYFEYGESGWGSTYCPDCGQALEWEVEGDENYTGNL